MRLLRLGPPPRFKDACNGQRLSESKHFDVLVRRRNFVVLIDIEFQLLINIYVSALPLDECRGDEIIINYVATNSTAAVCFVLLITFGRCTQKHFLRFGDECLTILNNLKQN